MVPVTPSANIIGPATFTVSISSSTCVQLGSLNLGDSSSGTQTLEIRACVSADSITIGITGELRFLDGHYTY
jgi:hypothetical protein